MKLVIGSDHAGFALKQELLADLTEKGYTLSDAGTYNEDSADYPLYGEKIARIVVSGQADLGIAVCGTGIGIGISANKVKGCRAVMCSEPYSAKMGREHNNANVLALGSRVVGTELAKMIVAAFLKANFLGERHARRVQMIDDIEQRN
ncbi:MAG: ribose 5-phosphate isomerase B [Sporolactobacillus sp.]